MLTNKGLGPPVLEMEVFVGYLDFGDLLGQAAPLALERLGSE